MQRDTDEKINPDTGNKQKQYQGRVTPNHHRRNYYGRKIGNIWREKSSRSLVFLSLSYDTATVRTKTSLGKRKKVENHNYITT